MSIFESTNPLDWAALDGVYIDELTPPPSVVGVASNVALLVGQFERGSNQPQQVGSSGQLFQDYGNNSAYLGMTALQNKRWGSLQIVRVVASGAAAATQTFANASSSSAVAFTALWKGAYGDNITVAIAAGTTSGSKYTIHDGNANAVWPDETYDNVVITSLTSATFALSNLIVGTPLRTNQGEPATCSATALASGSDGSVADADYSAAIALTETANLCNVIVADKYTTAIKGYMLAAMAATEDRMCVIEYGSDVAPATAITDVASYRDTDGRLVYSYPWVYTTINAAPVAVSPASFYAALISQIPPNIDPAYAANSQYLSGITGLTQILTRANYISLMAAGISAYEVDSDVGVKVKSGVVTQILNSAKVMVFRRRMADFLMQSLAKYLKNFQNAPNSAANQTKAGGGIVAFNKQLEKDGLVPTDAEVSTGAASIIDTSSLNDDDSVAQGYFKILYRRRIYSSMRFIVLQADISTSVVVQEVG